MNDIKLSEKHGINPSQVICIFCGEAKAIALVGRLPGDAEAPRKILQDYDPCDKCKEDMDKGIALIGVTETDFTDGKFPPISIQDGKKLWPTGSYAVMTATGFCKVFDNLPDDAMRDVLARKKMLVPHEHIVELERHAQSLSEGEGGEIKQDDTEPT